MLLTFWPPSKFSVWSMPQQLSQSRKVLCLAIVYRLDALQRLKTVHVTLVTAVHKYKNLKSDKKSIQPLMIKTMIWTQPKYGVTLLELFGAVSTSM